ncbi:hypothetical protein FKW77_005804 [Venturia effusa]|uniref:Chitobiosyldiphosphodolichol beta-mannosyltransferase n=1 Tax=Venturia effusa TaxID=50376 RepID=A0A517L7G5_9PEZI|nr:hypothetical protein FKW77_005804 [Venturia effusa]
MISEVLDSTWDVLLAIAVFCSTGLTIFLLTLPTRYDPRQQLAKEGVPEKTGKNVTVQILVLGDIGRSPHLIGYNESDVHPEIRRNPLITIVPLAPSPRIFQASNKLLFLFVAPLKILWQLWGLYSVLGYRTRAARWMLVQNPPSIPTLAIARWMCLTRNTRLIIDWHNFGYSILSLKLGEAHAFVKLSKYYEKFWATSAVAHFTVTNAMARVLKNSFGVNALPLHDRPPKHFQPLSQEERSSFLARLTETSRFAAELQAGTRKLIVSATSWTPDEDFSLLLDALVTYSTATASNPALPKLLAIITGKGPQKEHYQSKIAELNKEGKLSNVDIRTAWLSMEDYASLLGAADLGISLHTSSSGVDLPMKVVDMFGTGLPVLGWSKFEAWPELVTEDVNGKGFGSASELSSLLAEVLGSSETLERLRKGALVECGRRWDDEWDPVAGRLLGLVG